MMLLSDIHSEEPGKNQFYSQYLAPINNAQLLILAGDVGTFKFRDRLKDFLSESIKIYPHVLWVPGNHDYNGIESDEDFVTLTEEINSTGPGKVHLLHRDIIELNILGKLVTFAGCTLWSNAGWNRRKDRDSHINPNQRQLLHLQDKAWLENILSTHQDIIVITHHPPIKITTGNLSEYYSNSLESLTSRVRLWLFGHIHMKYDLRVNGFSLVSNPVGRFRDKIFFEPKFISLNNF